VNATTWGVTVPLAELGLQDHAGLWPQLADQGYGAVWTAEAGGTDAIVPLASAAAEPRLDIGCAVVSVFTRSPSVLAVTASTLARLAPGRVRFGLGSSSHTIVAGWNGTPFEKPFSRTRDVLRFLRQALTGERVTGTFDTFTSSGFRLAQPPETPPEILLAALRPRMLALAGDEADGVILNWVGAKDAGRLAGEVRSRNPRARVADRIMVLPEPDFDAVRRAVAPFAAGYLTTPVYRDFYRWLGHAALVDEISALWERGERREAVAAVPDELIDLVCVWGDPERCRRELAAYVDAGVTDPVLAVLPSGTTAREALAVLAPVPTAAPTPAG